MKGSEEEPWSVDEVDIVRETVEQDEPDGFVETGSLLQNYRE